MRRMKKRSLKNVFVESLREANREERDPKARELIRELKKRRFGMWKIGNQKKMVILAQKGGGRKGARFTDPRGKHWPDSFRLNDTEIMLLWEEDLENKEDVAAMLNAFVNCGRHEMLYIW